MELDYVHETKAPFNMAIATLMSLRYTLDAIRNVESRIDFPPEERQRIKIELVKRFYVDSSPLIADEKTIGEFKFILDLKPQEIISVKSSNQKQKKKVIYSFELNKQLDECLLKLQVSLQKNGKYYMPPSDDLGMAVAKMH